jgi:hypothetical protein
MVEYTSAWKSTRAIAKMISILAQQILQLRLIKNLLLLVIALRVVGLLADIRFILSDMPLVQTVQVASTFVCTFNPKRVVFL